MTRSDKILKLDNFLEEKAIQKVATCDKFH